MYIYSGSFVTGSPYVHVYGLLPPILVIIMVAKIAMPTANVTMHRFNTYRSCVIVGGHIDWLCLEVKVL